MATKSVLIIGGSGFIGTHLALRLREEYKVFATYCSRPVQIPGVSFFPLNVANRNWVKRVVYTANPDVVIYAAGSNSLEWAEADAREAEKIHTGGPATVSNVADILQPKFIYLSNCYAFDGHRGNYHESDIVLPGTALGKAKVGGENFIRGKSLNFLVVRSSPVFGRGNGRRFSFLDRLRMKLDRGERVEVPCTELHSFGLATGLADFVARLVDSGPKNKFLHYGGLTKATYYDFAKLFAQRFGYNAELLVPRRPQAKQAHEAPLLDYSLNSSQMAQGLKIKPLLLEESLDLFNQHLVPRA